MLRVMLVDDANKDLAPLRSALTEAGCLVVAEESSALRIPARVGDVQPDIIMFTDESDSAQIQAAIQAGVTAYIVAGMRSERIRPILEVALARFEQDRALREELRDAQSRLAERKVIEKAKGLLMAQRGCSEEEAYRGLRKLAMDRNLRLADIAQQVIDVAKLLT